jgi:hypothetical protein
LRESILSLLGWSDGEEKAVEREAGVSPRNEGVDQHGLAIHTLGGILEKEEWERVKQEQEREDAELARKL